MLPATTRKQPVVVWIVENTGIPEKGWHSVGVARQYCGQLGKLSGGVAVGGDGDEGLDAAGQTELPKDWLPRGSPEAAATV